MQPESLPLAGQIALVSGASRGIGAASARALAASGAHVVLVARDSNALESVEDTIHSAGGSATIAPLDVAEGDNIARLSAAIAERWGRLDLLVLNAAMLGTLAPIAATDMKELTRVFTVNVLAQHAMLVAFEPLLRRAPHGKVVALTSSVARTPRAYWGGYAASKAALENLVTTFGEEMRSISNVRTAILDPGATRTTMRARAFPGEDPASVKEPEVVANALVALVAEGFDSTHHVALGR
ncbi:MAG: SDR family NAD(P)-dependent oxidoreductase [Sphingopyxis sp.]|jgi:short-subunit dehydrogenase|nr:SDR family NAD(P)-dependent oxidoreductase [Sphingopyxis sp.]